MKNIYVCLLTIVFSIAANGYAEDSSQSTSNLDPTIAFFSALSACTAGDYMERNVLSSTTGPQYLSQHILGQDKNVCNVILTTPDNRILQCVFQMSDLTGLTDQHFLQGIMVDEVDTTNQDAVNADLLWSQLQKNNCNF